MRLPFWQYSRHLGIFPGTKTPKIAEQHIKMNNGLLSWQEIHVQRPEIMKKKNSNLGEKGSADVSIHPGDIWIEVAPTQTGDSNQSLGGVRLETPN